MQWRDTSIAGSLLAAAVLLASAPAGAGTLYRWQTANGTLAFADDAKRIPERYRGSAVEIQSEGLDGYSRFTPIDGDAQARQAEQLADRLGRLRGEPPIEVATEEPAVVEEDGGAAVTGIALGVTETTRRRVRNREVPRNRFRYQSPEQTLPVIELPARSDEDQPPVVVEEVQIKDWDGFTRRARIVRQGDQILSIVKGRKNHFNPRDIIRESELER